MRIFLKSFLGALLALFVFALLVFVMASGWIAGLLISPKPSTGSRAVLVVDLAQTYQEQKESNPLSALGSVDQYDKSGLYDLVRALHHAQTDTAIKGIWLKCEGNPNGYGTSEEIRHALVEFRHSGKFVVAFGDVISQKAYYIASAADHIYCNPKGGVEWLGMSSRMYYIKSLLQKLEIEPQIFYAGKFKSATEPLREDHMTDANRLQLTQILQDFFSDLCSQIGQSRDLDSATLQRLATDHAVQSASDALKFHLVDGLLYEDQIRDWLLEKMKLPSSQKLNLLPLDKYVDATEIQRSGKDKIAVIYAQGDVIDGKAPKGEIGDETFRRYLRTVRTDKDVKAVVLRVNSGGGSSLASENLWREVTLTRKKKPVVVSFGDVAASGAYYLSCNADSIFAQRNTITGSIGVFAIVPNTEKFFKNKLGISFDGVKTAPDADMLSVTKALSPLQRAFFQSQVDTIYQDFKARVSQGRNKSLEFVDSIAQGRIWSGTRGLQLGLVDRLGGLQDAIDCAARMAKTSNYRLKEYPEPLSLFEQLFGDYKKNLQAESLRNALGAEPYSLFESVKKWQKMQGKMQTRMPFEVTID